MDCEITTLHDNHTWELTKLPHDGSETKGCWVYTIKQGKQPGNVQVKARYVARGFSQIQGLDYEETLSPTTRFTSIRMLLQKEATENLHTHQMDVKGAYLNAPIDKDIYVQQPPVYVKVDEKGTPLTCHIKKPDGQLLAYTDSNWENDLNDRRSISSFAVTRGSAPISWRSRKQPTVSLSSCKAEYIALAEAVKEILYLRSLCLALAIKQSSSTVLFCENQGALALTKETSKQHQRTKYIDVKYHFIREQRDIDYRYIATNENSEDIFIQALSKVPHQNILKGLQIEGAC